MQIVTLNLTPGSVAPVVYASQNDDGRLIRFKLVDGDINNSYSLNGLETITAYLTKPDGTETTIAVTNPGSGKSYIDLVNGASDYDQEGVYLGEIVLTRNATVLGTGNFILEVEADAYGSDVEVLSVHGSPAHFETDLADNAVECKVDIAYNANGYKSALLVNTSNAPSEDSTPYLFRPSFANGYGYETLIGGTCGVNQLATGFVTQTLDDLTITNNNDGSITVNGTASANGDMTITGNIYFLSTHKYLIKGYKKVGSNNGSLSISGVGIDSGNGNIWNNDISNINLSLRFAYSSGDTFNNVVMYPQIFDLTAMFGTTIADYVYTLETNTSGAGITWLKNNGFFGADYYPYNAGGLLSVKTSKKITTGANWWGDEKLADDICTAVSTSAKSSDSNGKYVNVLAGAAVDEVVIFVAPFKENTQYSFIVKARKNNTNPSTNLAFQYTDGTQSPIQFPSAPVVGDVYTFVVTSTASKTISCIKGFWGSGESYLYYENCGVFEGVKTVSEYQPYISHEYPLDGSRKVHRFFGIVDLGEQTWDISGNRCSITLNDIKLPANNDSLGNYICAYKEVTANENIQLGEYTVFSYDNINKIVRFYYDGTLPSGDFVYELATPFDETVSNPELRGVLKLDSDNNLYYYGDTCNDFTNPMQVDGNGTEEFVDGRTVEMPVGHSTIYGEDMKARFTDFGVTVYGGEYNLTTGVLTSTKNADGTDKNPPDVYNLTPVSMPVRNGENYVKGNTNGDAYIKYYKKA